MKTTLSVLFVLFTLALSLPANIIVQEPNPMQGTIQIEYHEPVGQSFTAVSDTLLGFEFAFNAINSGEQNTPIILSIREGNGTSGTVLASATLILANNYLGWAGSAFSVNTVVGQTYTATLDATGAYWGIMYNPFTDYTGGRPYPGGFGYDFAFRATFADPSVPEPSTYLAGALLLLPFGATVIRSFRKNREA